MTNHLTDEHLNEYLDSGAAVSSAAHHLDSCPACRARLEELRAVFTALESLPDLQLSRDLAPSILARLPASWGGLAFRPAAAQKWIITAQALGALAIAAWLSSSLELPAAILAYQPPTLDSILASFFALLSSFDVQLSTFNLPTAVIDLQSSTVLMLAAAAILLGVVGNGILLRASPRKVKT